MQAMLYVRPLLQLRTIRAYRELAYSICCYAVVAVVVLAATTENVKNRQKNENEEKKAQKIEKIDRPKVQKKMENDSN